jgi:acyl-coenzyme A synthetase/AMP-(fatty) acid ligase
MYFFIIKYNDNYLIPWLVAALRKCGVKKGDRVVGYIPNCAEAIEAMAATAAIGAIWSSTSPDFGVSGVLDRFSQIQPKVISTNVLFVISFFVVSFICF